MMADDSQSPSSNSSLFGTAVGRSGNSRINGLSPYLNVDPSFLQSASPPEFIFDQDESRGRMENSFTATGGSVIIGSILGCGYGLAKGIVQTSSDGLFGKTRRTQILNHALKSGSTASYSLGSISVIYSSIYCLLSLQYEEDDALKSCVTGSLTGAFYKSTSGLKKCGKGAAFGLGLSSLWSFWIKKNEIISYYV